VHDSPVYRQAVSNSVRRMLHNDCKWGDVIEWCNEAVCGVTACTILTSGCCAWIHIESAIEYAPPPGYAIIYIRWVLNILTQDVVHTVTSWAVVAGCSGEPRPIWRGAQGCRHRMYAHTYIHTDWLNEWMGMSLTNNVQWCHSIKLCAIPITCWLISQCYT